MATFAIVKIGGQQFKVHSGQRLKVMKLKGAEDGKSLNLAEVYLVADGDKISVGKPTVSGAKVSAKVLKNGRGKKIWVYKYKSKTRQRKTKNIRPEYTELLIEKIG